MRRLTDRELNRAVLARQSLLTRSTTTIPRLLQAVGGLQTQYAPSGYVGLWSRLATLRRSAVTDALTSRTIVQGTLMRGTIHMVSRRDYPAMAAGIRGARREWWSRIARSRGLDGLDHERLAAVVASSLDSGPRTRSDLVAAIVAAGFPSELWEAAGLWVDMVRVPPSGTWERRRADLYGLAESWIEMPAMTEEDGLGLVLRRYLAAFGPAPLADAANWAGVGVSAMRGAAERLTLRRYADSNDRLLVDLPGAALPAAETPAPVRFLPTWDAVLLAHARRSGVLPEEYRPLVFHTRNPQSVATFLVDGRVAGSWRLTGTHLEVTPYEPLGDDVMVEVRREADALAAFHLSDG